MFKPTFTITPGISKCLMDIEASRQAVSALPITLTVLNSLRESARLTATHYSTQIEGNRLTQGQVGDVIKGGSFPNRERDEHEVKNYYQALVYVDGLIEQQDNELVERQIQIIHGLIMEGREKPSPYRDGQNVIRNSAYGALVYMPPEAPDVTALMDDLIEWVNAESDLPAPIIAAIAHYQFATIHPYYDGNGRTARLLANLVLHRLGYGLKGIYSLEEYYARDLQSYYEALTIGPSHNYYMGRAEADITKWLVYFCAGMADAFATVRSKTESEANQEKTPDQSHLLRELDERQKQVLALFQASRFVTTKDIAVLLKLHTRSALNLCHKWIDDGFIIQSGTSKKLRKYELADKWAMLVL